MRACRQPMRLPLGGILLLAAYPVGILSAGPQDSELNVNSRYTVETVLVNGDGWSANLASDRGDERISAGLRRQLASIIGNKLNPAILDELAGKLRREFQARSVTHRLLRGSSPEFIQVLFELKLRPTRFDVSVPKFVYNSSQGFSGGVDATATIGQRHVFTFGAVSDGDDLVERYSGIHARYEDNRLGSDRLRFGFEFASYQDLWNPASRTAAQNGFVFSSGNSGFYHSRREIQPELTFVLARPLTLSVGAGFEQLQDGAQPQAADALITTLRYRHDVEQADSGQNVDADYGLRAATRLFGSDFVYLRHHWAFQYILRHGKQTLSDRLLAGMLVGRAPLFEHFVLGNSTTLRGWDKYEIDPLGGNRVVENSVEYRFGWFQAFYDSGSVWDSGQPKVWRHSMGLGIHQGPVFLAVAFPARSGRVDPMFLVSMNY